MNHTRTESLATHSNNLALHIGYQNEHPSELSNPDEAYKTNATQANLITQTRLVKQMLPRRTRLAQVYMTSRDT